jgi:hypothetical protein
MTTNITTKFKAGPGVAVTTEGDSRILAIHAFSPVSGTFDIQDTEGSKIKFQVAASGTADIYVGELGIRCKGTVSVSTPNAGGVTLIVG